MISCDRCNRWFNNNHDYHQHIRNSPLHFVCWDCNIDFEDWDGLEEHYEVEHHYCSECRKLFKNEHGLQEHCRQSPRHFYCPPCQKHFDTQNSLDNVRSPQVPVDHCILSSFSASQIVCPPPKDRSLPDERVRAIFYIPRRSRSSSRSWFLHVGHEQVQVRPAYSAVRQKPPYRRSITTHHGRWVERYSLLRH